MFSSFFSHCTFQTISPCDASLTGPKKCVNFYFLLIFRYFLFFANGRICGAVVFTLRKQEKTNSFFYFLIIRAAQTCRAQIVVFCLFVCFKNNTSFFFVLFRQRSFTVMFFSPSFVINCVY